MARHRLFSHPLGPARGVCLLASILLVLAPPAIQAQSAVSGIVRDSAGVPIAGATVTLSNSQLPVSTGDDGHFRFAAVPAGAVTLKARRLGFVAYERNFRVYAGQPVSDLEIRLGTAPRMLTSVIVKSTAPQYKGRLGGYYKRLERRQSGHFITRDQIDKKGHRALSQLLRTLPGVNSVALRGGGNGIRVRGQGCRPLVWIDGVPMPAGEVDLDAFPTTTLHGIEVYNSNSASVPMDFLPQGGTTSCGTILLWSRGPDTEPARHRSTPVQNLEALIQSLKAYSVEQVDKPAAFVESPDSDLEYPAELYAQSVGGSVLAEFVVDSAGQVEEETITIVSSTNSLFSAAVINSLQKARYTPAVKDGKPVRQVVQQPFYFTPGLRKASRSGQ